MHQPFKKSNILIVDDTPENLSVLRHADWNPDVMPCMDLTEQDVENMAENLVTFHQEFHSCFIRAEQRRLKKIFWIDTATATSSVKTR
ncbi:MAG: hypothetical protein GY799_04340 [Desulfobulbaceae bacterium]|nr:hypothetical protein [Desulfobulbaceae bacterium]